MPSLSGSLLRQLSAGRSTSSRRWGTTNITRYSEKDNLRGRVKQMEGLDSLYGTTTCTSKNEYVHGNGSVVVRKRVMVVVDETSNSRHAVMWALTHASNKGDILTLLHVVSPPPSSTYNNGGDGGGARADSCSPYLVNSLGSLCKASKPEVEVEALVIQGPKLATIMSQVKKLEVAVCVLGQKKCSPLLNPLINCFCGASPSEELVEDCINNLECLTIGVRKQSNGVGGYLISTKWQKDFWLLA